MTITVTAPKITMTAAMTAFINKNNFNALCSVGKSQKQRIIGCAMYLIYFGEKQCPAKIEKILSYAYAFGHTAYTLRKGAEKLLQRFNNRCKDNSGMSRRQILRQFTAVSHLSQYTGDGYGDYAQYWRMTSNGIGAVVIAPDEPCNNFYTADPVVVNILSKRIA